MRDDFYGKMYYAPGYTEGPVLFQNGNSCFYVWTDRTCQRVWYNFQHKLNSAQQLWLEKEWIDMLEATNSLREIRSLF